MSILFPSKRELTLFGRQSTKKEVFFPQAWSDLSYVCSRLVASYYWWATPAFRVHHRRHFLILGRYGKRRWLFEDKAIDYLRPCSQRLSTFRIWYWGELAIKHLSKRWKKHTFQTGIKKIRREIKARKHLVSPDFDWETHSIWLNQRKEQVTHDLNDQAMKSSFVDLKLKWRREWSWKSSWLLWISCSCVLTWSHLC